MFWFTTFRGTVSSVKIVTSALCFAGMKSTAEQSPLISHKQHTKLHQPLFPKL